MSDTMKMTNQDKEIIVNKINKKNNMKNVKGKKIVRSLRKNMNPPKIPNVGYIRFKKERRPKIINENPFLSFIKIKKILLTEWKQLPAFKKMEYLSAANQEQSSNNKNYAFNKTTPSILKKTKVEKLIGNKNRLKRENSINYNSNDINETLGGIELKLILDKLNDKKKEIVNLEKQMNDLSISLSEKEAQLNNYRLLYQKQMATLKTCFFYALSKVKLPGAIVQPSDHCVEYCMSYISSIIQSNESKYLVPFIEGRLDHLDISKFFKK